MKGIEKITARIQAEAAEEAARIEAEGKARAAEIAARGETLAQERYWQKIQEGAKAAEERKERLAKAADMEARKSILAAKQAIVADAFRRAEETLCAMSGEEYLDFLTNLAVRASSTGTEEIVLGEKDQSLGEKVAALANDRLAALGKAAKLTVASKTGDFAAGLILARGNISINCTVEALMNQARESMAAEVAAELFS